MARHTTSGRWKLGLALSFTTASLWATLPIALKVALRGLDPLTLTWFRFMFAAVAMGLWGARHDGLAPYRRLSTPQRRQLLLVALLLTGNYVFYLIGLHHTTPGNAQLMIQLAPLLMAMGGVLLFRENFRLGQWFGLLGVALGLILFFNEQHTRLEDDSGSYTNGALFMGLAAVSWAAYALVQKQLLLHLSSPNILLAIYTVASVVLLPLSEPGRLLALPSDQWLALIYCSVNTLGAYGAFAEALAHWEASRVSVILALTPLLTLGCVEASQWWWPGLVPREAIGLLGAVGAMLVVTGSATTSLLGRRPRVRPSSG